VKEIGSIIWHGGKAILFNPEIRAERLNPRNLIEDLATGAMAVDDGFNPFGDPFAEGGFYDEKDTTNQLSKGLGAFSRNTLIMAGTMGGAGGVGAAGGAGSGAVAAAGAVGRGAIPKITGFTRHGLNMAISKDGVGVAGRAMLEAVRSPLRTVAQEGGKTVYIGKNATVVLNQSGQVVSTWATSSRGWRITR